MDMYGCCFFFCFEVAEHEYQPRADNRTDCVEVLHDKTLILCAKVFLWMDFFRKIFQERESRWNWRGWLSDEDIKIDRRLCLILFEVLMMIGRGLCDVDGG
ncbi:hypothetical protein U1Q18_049826 [Sarracenia purpurea var. burkii]